MKNNLMGLLAGAALVAAPTMASAAPTAGNPAASLSVAKSVRAGTPAGKDKLAGGGGLFGLAILAGIVAIVVVAVVRDDNSDSN